MDQTARNLARTREDTQEPASATPEPATEARTRANTLMNLEAVPMSVANNATLLPEESTEADTEGYFSVRMTPFIDHSSNNPHMFFGPIIRRLRPGEQLDVGRYTERTRAHAAAPQGSSDMVVFKSKVVSRSHAQLCVEPDGKWYVRDVGSSSGTFLNHVRLSPPGEPSQKVAVHDSDVLQLGVDYRGGSEEVFRCVRVRLELNQSWRKLANEFTRQAHLRLQRVVSRDGDEDTCSICLERIAQCQALFVSPCSHWWHYGCIRPLLVKSYPHFICPNCKAMCHLEADLEDSLG